MKFATSLLFAFSLALLCACSSVGVPEGLKPVDGFDAACYMGTWHEAARLENSYEKGLGKVSADYRLLDDGSVWVVNKGFDASSGQWKTVKGRAYFTGDSSVGALKVTFCKPFYGSYNVIDLDKEAFSWAIVCGSDRSTLWILTRDEKPSKELLDSLVAKAKAMGFDVSKLVYPNS